MMVARQALLETSGESVGLRFPWLRECNNLSLTWYGAFMWSIGLSLGQQNVSSTGEAVSWTIVNGEENDREERPCFFGNSISANTFYPIVNSGPLSATDELVEGSIMLLVFVDAWVATVLRCLNRREKRSVYGQKMYAHPFTSLPREVINQLIGRIRSAVQIWQPEVL